MSGKDKDMNEKELLSALKKCRKFIDEILPQIGKLSIQDYQNMNEALMESSEILRNESTNGKLDE